MTAQNDLDRTLGAWFGAEAAVAPPAEPLARAIESTRNARPRPSFVASFGSHWVGGSMNGVRGCTASLRPALVVALVALLALAVAGGAVLVGSRLLAPRTEPHVYVNELVSAPDLPTPMLSPMLVTLADNRVLVIGDGDDVNHGTTALVYDPATGTSASAGPMMSADGSVSLAIRLLDGRVLIIGDAVNQIFDPTTMQFAAVGPAVTPRSGGSAALLFDGRVLIAGGMPPGGTAGDVPALRSAELFDPVTMTSTPTGSIGTSTGGGPMVTLPDGRVFLATDPAAEIYDPATGTFSAASTTTSGGRGWGHPVALPDGRVVVAGPTGLYSGGSIAVWDPISSTFSVSSLPEPLFGATLLDDGRVFLVGMCRERSAGWTGVYDPTTGVTIPGQATQSCRPTAARLPDGRVLIAGGAINELQAVPTVEIFR